MNNWLKILCIAVFVCLTHLAQAAEVDKYKLKTEFGPQLTSAPFVIRYKFERDMKTKWANSSFTQRKKFLTMYHENLENENKAEKERLRLEKEETKERNRIEKEKDRALKDKKKSRLDRDKEKARQLANEKRTFNERVRKNKQNVKELRMRQRDREQKI